MISELLLELHGYSLEEISLLYKNINIPEEELQEEIEALCSLEPITNNCSN
jgi:hypothetical protein